MKILASGCSMTSGFETTAHASQTSADLANSWPEHLSRVLGVECHNIATPGWDNECIWLNLQAELIENNWNPLDTLVIIGWTSFDRRHYCSEQMCMYLNPWSAKDPRTYYDHRDRGFVSAADAWVRRDPNDLINSSIQLMSSAQTWLRHYGYRYIWVNTLGGLGIPQWDLTLSTRKFQPCTSIKQGLDSDPAYLHQIDQYTWLDQNYPGGRVVWDDPGFKSSEHNHWDSASLKLWAEHVYAWAKEKGHLSDLDQSNFKN